MSELPDLEISKLPSIDAVNKDTDYLVISKESVAFASGYGSFKVTPNQLMQAVSTTNLSDLGDVNISSPENEQVLKYNGSSWVNSDDDKGTEVEANPSEAATDTLTSIKIDNNVYSIEEGGSNVVANPTGAATATLNKLQVDETIYRIEGGGGGSADHITLTQAEYDALVEAGTVDPDAFYFISDAVFPQYSHDYSTSEKIVGTWIDGSTVYEKTAVFENAIRIETNDWNSSGVSNTGISLILDCTGFSPNGTFWGQLMCTPDDANYLLIGNSRNSPIEVKCITIRYTKSTS